jgi:hypothetical protein
MVIHHNTHFAVMTRFLKTDGLFLILLALFFYLRFLLFIDGRALFAPFQDNVYIHGPLFSALSQIRQSGETPFWVPYFFTGVPMYNTPCWSINYPFYFFDWLSYGAPLNSLFVLTKVTLFHLFVLAINVYIMCRTAGANGFGALMGAGCTLLATNTAMYACWPSIAAPYAWFPLFVAGGIQLVRNRKGSTGVLMTSGGAALMTLASPAQPVIHGLFYSVFFFGVAAFWLNRKFGRTRALNFCSLVGLSGLITLLLAAVAVVPMFMATSEMIRFMGDGGSITGYQPIPWKSFTALQLSRRDALSILWPTGFGVVGSPYIGPIAGLGIFASFLGYRRMEASTRFIILFGGAIGLYFLVASFGSNLGLAYLHYYVPFFNKIREPERHLVIFVFMASLLCGLGFTYLPTIIRNAMERGTSTSQKLTVGLSIAVALALLLCPQAPGPWNPATLYPGIGIVITAILLFKLFRIQEAVFTGLMVGLLPINHLIAPTGATTLAQSQYAEVPNLNSHEVLRALAASPADLMHFRVDYIDSALAPTAWAMNGVYHCVRSLRGFMQPIQTNRITIENHSGRPGVSALFGAKYIICAKTAQPPAGLTKILLDKDDYRVYVDEAALPRTMLVHQIAGGLSTADQILDIASQGFDFSDAAWVNNQDLHRARLLLREVPPMGPRVNSTVNAVDETHNRIILAAATGGPALLVFNEVFSHDWHATMDGFAVATLPVNGFQTGLFVPKGNHKIVIEYKPVLFMVLSFVQKVTLLMLILFAGFALIRLWKTGRRTV